MSRSPGIRWWLVMAWRDSRRHRLSLLCFTLAMVSGVGALVAVNSFTRNLESTLEEKARTLLGADLLIASNQPFPEVMEAFFREVGGAQSRQTRFASMAYFPEIRQSRLVAVRGIEGGYPYYGEIDTEPEGIRIQDRADAVAIVDASLMAQFGLEVGDPIRIGNVEFSILGRLLKTPGETAIEGIFSPRIYVPYRYVEATDLIRVGSIAYYNVFFQFEDGLDPGLLERLESKEAAWMEKYQVWYDTVETRREEAGRILENVNRFLSLVGFVALILGAVGIAGAIQLYLKQKIDSVAVLRCLGATNRDASAIFLLQAGFLGFIGALLGGVLGVAIQQALPWVLNPFIPLDDIEVFLAWPAIWGGVGFGWAFTLLFLFIPLIPISNIAPLRALRASIEPPATSWRNPRIVVLWLLIVLTTTGFALWQTRDTPLYGLVFVGGLGLVLSILSGLAFLLRAGLRRLPLKAYSFSWRQGLANLYRPQNRTVYLVTTLGMGLFLLYTLHLTERALVNEGSFNNAADSPNLVLFDIQPYQEQDILQLLEDRGLPILGHAPVVTMNLQRVNGKTIRELEALEEAGEMDLERWALFQEYRTTYRDSLSPEAKLVKGSFTPRASLDSGKPVPISVEKEVVRGLDLELGDQLVFNVQGFSIETVVDSIREVDWNSLNPNFLVVFPRGVLEQAPTFYVTATRVDSPEALGELQRDVVSLHANVVAIDLERALQSIGEILDRVSFVIRFMAGFTVVTGLILLIISVMTSRYQRVKESVLLRTLGASGNQIRQIIAIEYALTGTLAGLVGGGLALLASSALAHFVFQVVPVVSIPEFLGVLMGFALLTTLVGLLNSRGIAGHPPLEVLRKDQG